MRATLLLSLLLLALPLLALALHCEAPSPFPDWILGQYSATNPDGSAASYSFGRFVANVSFAQGPKAYYVLKHPLVFTKSPSPGYYRFDVCAKFSNMINTTKVCGILVPRNYGYDLLTYAQPPKPEACPHSPTESGLVTSFLRRLRN